MDYYELENPSEPEDIIIERVSPFSPYMLPRDSYPDPKYTDDIDFNQKYAARVASTPLTPEELGLVRGHLGDIFHEYASCWVRWQPAFRTSWARHLEMASAPQCQDGDTMRWFDIRDYANKQTAVYFVGRGSKPDDVGHRHGYLDYRLGFYMYRIWYALHGGRPNLQRHHFFAKALRVPESKARSWSIPGLVAAHRRLCDATAARLGSEVVRLRSDPRSELVRLGCEEDIISGVFPPPVETARTWCEHGLSLHHLFRAVVLVADEHVLPVECPVQPVPEFRGHNQAWNVAAWLERLMPECSVLMVRTGDDTHLSRPVSFERLIMEGKTIPLGLRKRKLAKEFGVVRVKIGVAMRFLFDLQAEEEAAIPSLRQVSAMLTEERERACHAWVESVLQHASLREVGVDRNWLTWEAVRRIWAERDGEIFNHASQDVTRLTPIYSFEGLR